MSDPDAAASEVAAVLRELNDAWLRPDGAPVAPRIRSLFRDAAVVVGPDLQRTARGAEAVARSYDEFIDNATVFAAELDEPEIDVDVDASVAVATLRWRIRYRLGEREFTENGHDVYVVVHADGGWKIAWRQIVSAPPPSLPEA